MGQYPKFPSLQVILLKNERLWSHHASNVSFGVGSWDRLCALTRFRLQTVAWSTVCEYIHICIYNIFKSTARLRRARVCYYA